MHVTQMTRDRHEAYTHLAVVQSFRVCMAFLGEFCKDGRVDRQCLCVVFHELSQVQERLEDLRGAGRGLEGHLQCNTKG